MGMYPYSREINGAFRPSPSAIGRQAAPGYSRRWNQSTPTTGRFSQSTGKCELAVPPPPLSMNAAIDRVPKQSLYTAVELDAWAGTVGPQPMTPSHDHPFEDLCRR